VAEPPSPPAEVAQVETSIRVDVALLDKLMNLVGELVLARNQIIQFTGAHSDATFLGAAQQLNLITTELQEGVMKTRMQPIGNIWHKFPRVVRDLARSCDKRVELVMEGESTELDKTLIEAIKDPLTHLVRNSVDHGIESPDRRAAAGKPPVGRLLLRAYHEGGQVNVEVIDDGGGLDAEKIRDKAIERGIISADQASRMGEREMLRLIFLPGFSTAAKVTNVSGRGVGMDVVRTNIERIGGTIDLHGKRGVGTTIKIKIPLTLAIIPALVVASGENRYAIPQASLVELVHLEGERARDGVELLYGVPVYRLRGKLLTLVYLADALQDTAPPATNVTDEVSIVVLQADDRQFGLVVQAVHDTEEIVVKPLGKHLKGTPVFAGATIMGDGRVALILDILGLAKHTRVLAAVLDQQLAADPLDHAARKLLEPRDAR
jgi:two-component system chemotaxis sensor kinase CheA